jgi:hypothetical protein
LFVALFHNDRTFFNFLGYHCVQYNCIHFSGWFWWKKKSVMERNTIPMRNLFHVHVESWVVCMTAVKRFIHVSERRLRSTSFRSICMVLEFNGRCASSYS